VSDLFSKANVVGVFRGFREGGMEFHADLALPYQTYFNSIPMHGQFLLVQLETPDEAVLGRIASLSSEGRLAGSVGEDYSMRAIREDRNVPEQLRTSYLKYRVTIRVLGVVRRESDRLLFVPSQRRLPHVGSPVAFVAPEVMNALIGGPGTGTPIGVLALGEYVYSGDSVDIVARDWMRVKHPRIDVRFKAENLVARRTFVFARAGFGKSNLNKLLFSALYQGSPTVEKSNGRRVPVGTIIFDPDGEYFWPDDKDRPGLCDVPELSDQVVVFTSRAAPSAFYGSFVAGGIKLDIRRLQPADVISIALSPEKQDQQNVRKLRGMNLASWGQLVDLIDRHGNSADLGLVQQLLHLDPGQEMEAFAARANMTGIVRMLHDRSSQLMDLLLHALSEGKLCVVDVSQLRGGASRVLSGLILRRIFDRNQEEFTKSNPMTIPTIAVIEEAQAVLQDRAADATPFVEWVKEGRKYDLGAMLITQQPGSIPGEILSQGDNWFVFHLLAAGDLQNVHRANAHFSDDLLSALLNEPIPGQGLMWSSVAESPFPIPLRVISFENLYKPADQTRSRPAIETYASAIRRSFVSDLGNSALSDGDSLDVDSDRGSQSPSQAGEGVDALRVLQERAIEALRSNSEAIRELNGTGLPWGKLVGLLRDELPVTMSDRNEVAYAMVAEAVSSILGGPQGVAWATERRGARNTTFVFRKAP